MQVPVMEQETCCGFLRAEQRGLYMVFYGEVELRQVMRLYAVFEQGEIPLGIPVPEQGKMILRMSLPAGRMPQGRLLRGELRPKDAAWQRFSGGRVGNHHLPPGRVRGNRYQFPWKQGQPLPYTPFLCFYQLVGENGREYLEVVLDQQGNPLHNWQDSREG